MKHFVLALFVLVSIGAMAQSLSTMHVTTHNRTTIVCDAGSGAKSFKHWGIFPATYFSVRKIKMKVEDRK